MPSSFEKFKQQIDSAVELISQNQALDDSKSKEGSLAQRKNLEEIIDTQSLLERCNVVYEEYCANKPTIRILHQLACSGGTLISNYISAMPNVSLVREVNPSVIQVSDKDKPKFQLSDVTLLAKHSGIPKRKALENTLLKQAIDQIYQHVTNQGATLVLVEDVNVAFEYGNFTHTQSELVKLLGQDYNISSVLAIQSPVDVYENICLEGRTTEYISSLAEYCIRFSNYLEHFPFGRVFSDEVLSGDAQKTIEGIAQALELPFDKIFQDISSVSAHYEKANLTSLPHVKNISADDEKILNELNEKLSQYGINLITSNFLKSQILGIKLSASAPLDIKNCIARLGKLVIVVAGMRHSGSTALFNILRLLVKNSGFNLFSCYSEDVKFIDLESSNSEVILIKTHELRDDIMRLSNITFTTIRDLRDTVASGKRRNFSLLSSVGGASEYAKYNRSLYESWEQYSNYEFNYEYFMEDPLEVISTLQAMVGLSNVSADDICNEVASLPLDEYETTLLSHRHITDPERTESYKTTLTREEQKLIEDDHDKWLCEHGYRV